MLDKKSISLLQLISTSNLSLDAAVSFFDNENIAHQTLSRLEQDGYISGETNPYSYNITSLGLAQIEKSKRENLYFWLPTFISIIAITLAALSLLLQLR